MWDPWVGLVARVLRLVLLARRVTAATHGAKGVDLSSCAGVARGALALRVVAFLVVFLAVRLTTALRLALRLARAWMAGLTDFGLVVALRMRNIARSIAIVLGVAFWFTHIARDIAHQAGGVALDIFRGIASREGLVITIFTLVERLVGVWGWALALIHALGLQQQTATTNGNITYHIEVMLRSCAHSTARWYSNTAITIQTNE